MDKQEILRIKRDLHSAVIDIQSKAYYADALFVKKKDFSIVKNDAEINISSDADEGFKLRAFDGEKLIEQCSSESSSESIKEAAQALKKKIKKKNKRFELSIDNRQAEKHFANLQSFAPVQAVPAAKAKTAKVSLF